MAALGLQEGIRFAFDRMERTPNTRQAHSLIAYASRRGRGPAAAEALFRGYFEEALDIGREDVLAGIAVKLGLDEAEVRDALHDEMLRASVVDIEHEAGRLGIGGVPFFIIDEKWSVSGAQSADVWAEALRRLHGRAAEAHGS